MNTNPLDAEKPPVTLPLLYISTLVGLVAAACPMLIVTAAVGIASSTSLGWLAGPRLFNLAFACAIIVMVTTGPVLFILIHASGMTGRWAYIAGTSVIIGGCFCLLWMSDPRIYFVAVLVPVASVPSGLLFHRLAQPSRFLPPIDRRDTLIVAIWVAAFIYSLAVFHIPMDWYDPGRRREDIARLAWASGLPAFWLGGIAAGLARLRSLRLGTAIAALTWLIPVGFIVAVLLTPRSAETFHFVVSDRAFDIDWHVRPYKTAAGFCFNPSARVNPSGPRYPDLLSGSPTQICVSQIGDPLVPTAPAITASARWIEAGLTCEEKLFKLARVITGRVCWAADAADGAATLIECSTYCFHQFDVHGLRYSIHWNIKNFADWRSLEERALKLVSEVGGDAVPPRNAVSR
jgi:hypothetical protein